MLGDRPHDLEKLDPGEAVGSFCLNLGLGENPRSGNQDWRPYYKTPVAGKCPLTHTVAEVRLRCDELSPEIRRWADVNARPTSTFGIGANFRPWRAVRYVARASVDAPLNTSTILPVTPPAPSNSCACLASVRENRRAMRGLIFFC